MVFLLLPPTKCVRQFGFLAAELCRRFRLLSYPHLKFFQPNVPWADWGETRSPTEEGSKLLQVGHWNLAVPMRSPQGHRHCVLGVTWFGVLKHLRVGRHRMVSAPVICAKDTRLVPGLELLARDGLGSQCGFWH